MRRRPREQTIFFPWERGGSFFRQRGSRLGPIGATVGIIALLLLLGTRERRLVGIRSTRATISLVASALDAYRADHEHQCPATLEALKVESYLAVDPTDAWGRPIRLVCPGRRDPQGYELMSDGPDREMGGLDRVE